MAAHSLKMAIRQIVRGLVRDELRNGVTGRNLKHSLGVMLSPKYRDLPKVRVAGNPLSFEILPALVP
jgi:hypothetical protein